MANTEQYRAEWANRSASMMRFSLAEYVALKEAPQAPEAVDGPQKSSEAVAVAKNGRARRQAGEMNGLEKRYAAHLGVRQQVGEIQAWVFEPLKLKLAPATFYAPDFLVVLADGSVELHETKGHWEDDARVKIKCAARMFPWWQFVGVQEITPRKSDWKFERFKA